MTDDARPDHPRAGDEVRARARSLAFAAYRRAGRLGRRVLGPDPTAPDPVPPGPDVDVPPWVPLPEVRGVLCNVCRWQGAAFDGTARNEERTRARRVPSRGFRRLRSVGWVSGT